MRTIWKYQVPVQPGPVIHDIPRQSFLLHVGEQNGLPTLWFDVMDKDEETKSRMFHVIGTGWNMSEYDRIAYMGTVQIRGYVWHIYEEL